MREKEVAEYVVKGKVETKGLPTLPEDTHLLAYAVRDRRIVGSAPIQEDGRFEIRYEYPVFGKDREPYGVDLIIGPELPGDQILSTEFERKFLSGRGFKRASPDWEYELAETLAISDQWRSIFDRILPLMTCQRTYTGFVYTCSPLNDPPGGQAGCVSQQALSGADTEAYVRLMSTTGLLIAEDLEVDLTGRFEHTVKWKVAFGWICAWILEPTRVEVYQKTESGDHLLYSGEHVFHHNVAEDIFIDRDKVEIITKPPLPTPGTSNYFGFERIGNIPVEAVYKAGEVTGEFGVGVPVPSEFIGYVNSVDKPGVVIGSADKPVKDYALGGSLHLYANLGEGFGQPLAGGVDMSDVTIKYFRIKYSYENPETGETLADSYLSVPFYNTRKVLGGTTGEFLGAYNTHPVTSAPLPDPTYIYPNPYETDPTRDWKYRGLLLVLDTHTLPRKYGRYTFTVEPLDVNMNPVAVADADDCILTLLIDNDHDALSGEIEDILRGGVGTPVCGFIDLRDTIHCAATELEVKYTIDDSHGNLQSFTLSARYGKDKSLAFTPTGSTYVRSGATPYWTGVQHKKTAKELPWRQCAYEFRLKAWRKVTNGFYTIPWKEFTYHVTILSNTDYSEAMGTCAADP